MKATGISQVLVSFMDIGIRGEIWAAWLSLFAALLCLNVSAARGWNSTVQSLPQTVNVSSSKIFTSSVCWIESVDSVADLCLTNQIYPVLMNAFELKSCRRWRNATSNLIPRVLSLLRVARPRGCKYPTPPCALAKILPETTVRA